MADRSTNILNGWLLKFKTKDLTGGAPQVSASEYNVFEKAQVKEASWLDVMDIHGPRPTVGDGIEFNLLQFLAQLLGLLLYAVSAYTSGISNLYYWGFAYNTASFISILFCTIDHVTGGTMIYPMPAYKRYRLGGGEVNW